MLSETPAGRGRARQASRTEPRSLPRAVALGLLLAAAISAALLLDLAPSNRVLLNEGEVSSRDILAPADLTYESSLRTQQAQEAQARSIQDIYDPPNISVAREQEVRAQQILEYISTVRQDTFASPGDKTRWLAAIPDVSLPETSIGQILALSDDEWQQVRDETVSVLLRAMQGEIRESQLSDVRRRLPTLIGYGLTDSQTEIVKTLVSGLVKVNTQLNVARTEEARQQARASTLPVTATIRRGEAIVRAGDRVTALDVEALDAFGLRQQATRWQSVVGTILFSLVVVVLLEILIARLQPSLWRRRRAAAVLAILIALFVVMAKLMIPAAESVVPYLYPLPALSMIVTILFGPALGVAIGIVVAAIAAFVGGGSAEMTIYLLAGTLMGAMALGRAERLAAFLQAGLVVAGTNAVVILLFGFLGSDPDPLKVAIDVLAGVVMGGLAASLALATFLALSATLDVITPFQLTELARPTHPLFRQLLLKAPGTYHHTLLVSNMAEEAANRIGADGLLARVGAYYHDVGKTVRPYFFTENRAGEADPHERLDPRTSAQIIISHVHDGLDLAEKYRLPQAIRAFIPEHHGTGLTLSFYRLAVKAAGDQGEDVPEADFRYPGPRPQSKETAIVMLADGCEARVRSLKPSSVEEMDVIIRDTIKARLDARELDECDLTLRDLEMIRAAFLDVLQGVFHPRVQYPEPVKVKGPDGQEIVR
jgi:cyclic-di-AMP phosphodiesterase PgpH